MKLYVFLLLLALNAKAEPVVSKYDEDLTRLNVASPNFIELYKDVRDNARANLAAEGQRPLVDASYNEQECLKNCKDANCINTCVRQNLTTLGQAPINNNPQGEHGVDCTGRHNH